MRQPNREHRVLSLASSSVFLLSFAVFFYATTYQTTRPLYSYLAERWIPFLFVPILLPCIAILRLVHLRFLRKKSIPFFDGWFIHLVILLPYAITFAAMYPLWK